MPNEELMVWYCKDFATRLGYDIDPERATYSICKYLYFNENQSSNVTFKRKTEIIM